MFMTITETWQGMFLLEKLFWCCAIPFSFFFLIQMIMTFLGGDMDAIEVDGHADLSIDGEEGIGFQFISIKNLIAFFTIFGWVGIACIKGGLSDTLCIIIATIAGILMMVVMATLIYFMGKLTENGTANLNQCVGKIASVYLTIPKNRTGMGQVQVNIGGLKTLNALTDCDENINTGEVVDVIQVINDEILLVKPSYK
jgi:hypothetical protein